MPETDTKRYRLTIGKFNEFDCHFAALIIGDSLEEATCKAAKLIEGLVNQSKRHAEEFRKKHTDYILIKTEKISKKD